MKVPPNIRNAARPIYMKINPWSLPSQTCHHPNKLQTPSPVLQDKHRMRSGHLSKRRIQSGIQTQWWDRKQMSWVWPADLSADLRATTFQVPHLRKDTFSKLSFSSVKQDFYHPPQRTAGGHGSPDSDDANSQWCWCSWRKYSSPTFARKLETPELD